MNIERMGEQKKRSFVIVPYIGSEGHPTVLRLAYLSHLLLLFCVPSHLMMRVNFQLSMVRIQL